MKKKLIIFDMDGTLLNTLPDLTDSANFAFAKFGFVQRTPAEIKSFIGDGVVQFIERAIPNGQKNPHFSQCLELFKDTYSKNISNKTIPYTGIIDLLKNLKNSGYKIGIASNKYDSAVQKLAKKYFDKLIDLSVGEDEANGINKKPAPDMINKIAKELNFSKENIIYVGDSEVDLQTARNSNIPCISVTWGYKDKDFLINNGAVNLADTPQDIFEIIHYI